MVRRTLATLAVTQARPEEMAQSLRRREHGFAALLVTGLTLFAVVVHGYHPYAEDGGLYVAGIKQLLEPGMYARDAEFVLAPMRHSLFALMVAGLVRWSGLGLGWVLLLLHLGTIWATLFGAWMLAARCWVSREARTGAVALLACWLGLPVAGTALYLMDPYVTARSFSTPCMVLALAGVLAMTSGETTERRWGAWLWGGSLVVAVAMHPLMAAYALGASLLLWCARNERRSVRLGGTAALGVAAFGIAGLAQVFAPAESAAYVRIAMTRSYWFLGEWRWYEVLGLVAPLGILAMFGYGRRSDTAGRALARMAVAAGLLGVAIALAYARAGAASHLVARLQPMRVLQICYVVMALLLGAALGEWILRRSAWRWGVALAVLGGTMMVASRAAYPASRAVEVPGLHTSGNAWEGAFLWIRANAPKNALFALDADYINAAGEDAQCFRAIAERSALADYSKDGGEASIAPDLTEKWVAEQRAQQGLSAESDSERLRALEPLGVDWVVLQAGATTQLMCPYGNSAVKVCRLR